MSDYLSHLVERSFAPIPAVRPNTPSRFESSPAKSTVDSPAEVDLPVDSKTTASPQRPVELAESNASRIPNPARDKNHHAQRQFTGPPLSGTQEKTSAKTSAPFSPFATIPSPSQNSSPTPRHAEDSVRSIPKLPRTIQPVDNATGSTRGINAESHFSPEIRPNTAATKGTLRLDGSRPASPVTRKENGSSPSRETSAPPSTIHVTIGRVEIKATTPAPALSRTSPIKNQAMSLETYLQRRSNGGRHE